MNGKPRITHQVYLGTVESILRRFQQEKPLKSIPERKSIPEKKSIPERSILRMNKEKDNSKNIDIDLGIGKISLGGLFGGIGSLLEQVSKLKDEEIFKTGEIEGLGEEAKGVFGFTVKTGLGGTPTVERFGNIRETETGPVVEEVREPIIDVMEEKDKVIVIAELPGVSDKEIKVSVHDDILVIEASNKDRGYAKEVLLPYAVDASEVKRSYKNGILKVTLSRATEQ